MDTITLPTSVMVMRPNMVKRHTSVLFQGLSGISCTPHQLLVTVSNRHRENGSKITDEELDEAVRRRKVFADWIHEQVIGEAHKTIMVVPYGSPEPKYRDEVPPTLVGPIHQFRAQHTDA
jgi:hypothetical protein